MTDLSYDRIRAAALRIHDNWLRSENMSADFFFQKAVEAGVRLAMDGPPKVSRLTPRQRDLLIFITAFVDEHGYAPSFEEMMEGIGVQSKSSIFRLVEGLVERGAVARLPDRARAITLLARAA